MMASGGPFASILLTVSIVLSLGVSNASAVHDPGLCGPAGAECTNIAASIQTIDKDHALLQMVHAGKGRASTVSNSSEGTDEREKARAMKALPKAAISAIQASDWNSHSCEDGLDDEWCKVAGVQFGFEFKYFGAASPCGTCSCCKRALKTPEVTLPGGAKVIGKMLAPKGMPLGSFVHAYFNIRYATAGRFEAPSAYTAPSGTVIDGAVMNEPCFQADWGCTAGSGSGVEDCLTLAVFVPAGPPKKNRSVMVWIHGGNLVKGGVYVGTFNQMVQKGDVIVVALQYRLGLFGFMQPPGDNTVPANRGLRDQIEGLKWVQENIASFGGDPGSVTLWGQSAGGRSVSVLYQSPMTKGLFHRAIAQSPGMQTAMFLEPTSKSASTLGQRCMDSTGCTSVSCLMSMNASDLVDKCMDYFCMEGFLGKEGVYFSGYDGEVLPRPISDPLCEDYTVPNADKPMIVGSLTHEWRFFPNFPGRNMTDRFLRENMKGFSAANPAVQNCSTHRMLQKFLIEECKLSANTCTQLAEPGSPKTLTSATAQYTLGVGFSLGPGSGPRFHYTIDIEAANGTCGSCHCGDNDLLFGLAGGSFVSPEIGESKSWTKFGDMLQEYWLSFAKTGVPSSVLGPAWKPADNGKDVRTWGLPFMFFNLSTTAKISRQAAMSRAVYPSSGARAEVTDILCKKPPVPEQCAAVSGQLEEELY
mmetsp:Transcript_667/g.2801  ORF Transcript_667/g.2801 Transcript_667/m.2801 type:complete len:699 (-) Transcript_667:425-2521(-)